MNRRQHIHCLSGILSASSFASLQAQEKEGSYRVGIIGHSGRGNYGHGLDTVWLKIPNSEIVGVADPDQAGLEKELAKLRIKNSEMGFSSYQNMLQKTKPDFVSVCPRHADQHGDMVLASIEAGVRGIYVEKPYCRTPAETDQIGKAAAAKDTRIAVAHRNRYHPVLPIIRDLIATKKIGQLLEIRGRGKGDRRGGGEDLWVLGSHVLNLIHYFGGSPQHCSATILEKGEWVTQAHVKEGAEGLGPLAGDELHARFELDSGMVAYFDSKANDETKGAGFGLQLIASEGIINIQCDRDPVAHWIPGNPFQPTPKAPRPWIPITSAGIGKEEPNQDRIDQVHNHVLAIHDLISACEENRPPLCSHEEAALTVEMICAVFESHSQQGRSIPFPLPNRGNALSDLAGA